MVQRQDHVEKYSDYMCSAPHRPDHRNYCFSNAINEMMMATMESAVERMTGIHIRRMSTGICSSSAIPSGIILKWLVPICSMWESHGNLTSFAPISSIKDFWLREFRTSDMYIHERYSCVPTNWRIRPGIGTDPEYRAVQASPREDW